MVQPTNPKGAVKAEVVGIIPWLQVRILSVLLLSNTITNGVVAYMAKGKLPITHAELPDGRSLMAMKVTKSRKCPGFYVFRRPTVILPTGQVNYTWNSMLVKAEHVVSK